MEVEIESMWQAIGRTEDTNTRRIWGGYSQQGAVGEPCAASTPATPAIEKVNVGNLGSVENDSIDSCDEISVADTVPIQAATHVNILGPNYSKCKAGRAALRTQNMADVGQGENAGKVFSADKEKVGSLIVPGDEELSKTFRGTRLTSYGQVVNQSLSVSFDPGTMMCITCRKEHSILPEDGSSLVLIVSDQNFVTTMSGGSTCIPVVRMEDASLEELFRLTGEMLDRRHVPAGTYFLVGSASYLSLVGTSVYTMDWQNLVDQFRNRWRECMVGPLPPVLREDCMGSVGKSLLELRHWYRMVYGNSICFPKAAWDKVAELLGDKTGNCIKLDQREIYTIPLPASLDDRKLNPVSFQVSSTHSVTEKFGAEGTNELLRALMDPLTNQFGCNANLDEIIVVREQAEGGGADITQSDNTDRLEKIVLVVMGGSHSRRMATELSKKGFEVVDLSIPGWVPTDTNVSNLVAELKKLELTIDHVAVCDFTSNVVFRSLNLGVEGMACKIAGRYHMTGQVTTCSKESLSHFLGSVKTVLENVPGIKICLPPLPRYLFSPCCSEQGHCDGIGTVQYAPVLLEKTLGIRRVMKDQLYGLYGNSVVVPDTVQRMYPECKTTHELLSELEKVSMVDGVHLTREGYDRVADVVKQVITEKLSVDVLVSGGRDQGEKPVFWKGFLSPVGSSRPKNSTQQYKLTHSAGGKWRNDSRHASTAVYNRRGGAPSGGRRY